MQTVKLIVDMIVLLLASGAVVPVENPMDSVILFMAPTHHESA